MRITVRLEPIELEFDAATISDINKVFAAESEALSTLIGTNADIASQQTAQGGAEGEATEQGTPGTETAAPTGAKRGRKPKAPATAAPEVIAAPPIAPTAPAAPTPPLAVAPAPIPVPTAAGQMPDLPASLDRRPAPAPAAPPAAPPAPVAPAPIPVGAPVQSELTPRVIAHLTALADASPDQGRYLAVWLASPIAGSVVTKPAEEKTFGKKEFAEIMSVLLFIEPEKIAPIAAALQVA